MSVWQYRRVDLDPTRPASETVSEWHVCSEIVAAVLVSWEYETHQVRLV